MSKAAAARDSRATAIAVGTLFIVGTIAGLVSLGVFTDPILGTEDFLAGVSASGGQVVMGAFLELVMGVALVAMALAVYPVLRDESPRLAVGYVAVRTVEFVIVVISVISLMALVALSSAATGAGAATLLASGRLLLAIRNSAGHAVLDVAVFPMGALILNYAFFRAGLVPRWLAFWGLAGAVLYWAAGILVMFDLIVPLQTAHVALQAPLGLQEMVLAIWLIARGFSPAPAIREV